MKALKISAAIAVISSYAAVCQNAAATGGASGEGLTYAVEDEPGYNCWPMIQTTGSRLVCVYTIGKFHDPGEHGRAAFSRFSDDGGRTWSPRSPLFRDERCGTSSIGKGADDGGAALFWIRRIGIEPRMALYRTTDGETFDLIAAPRLSPNAMQITDIFPVPGGLMCLWFSDDYSPARTNKCWGTLTSSDNGTNWVQRVVERDLSRAEWPTEPSVVVLGDGRLLGIARCEGGGGCQFQLTSVDWGRTWRKRRTNIGDVHESTPTLVHNRGTGMVANYYYQRGAGLLKRRIVAADAVFDHPLEWPEPAVMAQGGRQRPYDSGNANAVRLGDADAVVYYSGDEINCRVLVTICKRPTGADFVCPRYVVSDTNRFTCGSGSVACISPDGKRILAPYLASSTGFGECHDLTAVADIPLSDPGRAASFELLKAGDSFCGTAVTTTVSYASFLWKGRMRVMLDVNFEMFGYREWDPETRRVTGEGLFRCRFAGTTEELSPRRMADYLTRRGLSGFNPLKERGDRCIWQSRPVWHEGAFYGFVTSSCSQPILFRCADGETFEFLGFIPMVAEYECQLAIHKGLFYAVMRGAKGDNFWTSADGGITWKGCGRVPDGLQRPQLLVWRGEVLIGCSAPDEKPCKVRNGRNNLHLLRGEGPDLATYREIMHAVDPIGIVYPDILDIGGDLHVLWSNSERFPTHVKWGAVQGKDMILYGRLSQSVNGCTREAE